MQRTSQRSPSEHGGVADATLRLFGWVPGVPSGTHLMGIVGDTGDRW
jgi:hypothetical protein